MSICAKCNTSIKPASLATTSGDDNFHPTCISCCKCDRPLWGRGFKRNKQRKLECDPDCETNGPIAVYRAKKPTSASKQNGGGPPVGSGPKGFRPVYDEEQTARPTPRVEPQSSYPSPPPPQPSATSYPPSPTYPPRSPFYPATQQQQPPPSIYDLNQYRKPGADLNGIKMCKTCGQNLQNKRYLTYESGETICQECEYSSKIPIPRVKSAHMIVCACCGSTLRGTKYFTEMNGDIVCENCDASGARCAQCKQLFRTHETKRTLPNGVTYHPSCFNCSSCGKLIQTSDFFQTDSKQPMCLDCYEVSKLPKCGSCGKHISGTYYMLDNKPIHDDCFKCSQCSSLLGNDPKGFFRNNRTNLPICTNCNIKLNGAKCVVCAQVIESDGIMFNDRNYHKHCYLCDSCETDLTKMKKTLTDPSGQGKYCEPCHVKKYAPKCGKCGQSIPSYLPFTQFEGKHYHKECFACSRCKKSLANKKFFKSGNITICEQCN